MLSSERQYVTVLKGVEETYLPLLELSDTPASIRGKADTLFPNWASLSTFHSQYLLPAMEGALLQSLLQQDCFSKYVSLGVTKLNSWCYIFNSNQVAGSTCNTYYRSHAVKLLGLGLGLVIYPFKMISFEGFLYI